MTKQRKAPKKGIAKRKRKRNTRESSDESEEDFGITKDEGELELLDCIEVEMESS